MNRNRAAARALILRRLVTERRIDSQDELVRLLAERGHRVTQATVSRDLTAIGAEKILDGDGERYVLSAVGAADASLQELSRRMREFVLDIGHSANLVVIRTPPGTAGSVAASLDGASLEDVLGTLGGDDTVLVVSRDSDGGAALARRLRSIMETQ
ncbi:MAG: arginine repressor [Acidobacteriota bacterium]